MRKVVCFIISVVLSVSLWAQKTAQVKQGESRRLETKKLFEEQKKAFGCSLTDEETRTAVESYFKANPVVFDSEQDPSRHGRVLLAAIRKLNAKKDDADKIYQEMELQKKGITKRQWDKYVKNDMAQAQLMVNAARMPKNQEELDKHIVELFSRTMKDRIEAGLLACKILNDYNAKNKEDSINEKTWNDWGIETSKKKKVAFNKWWSEKLMPDYPDKAVRDVLCKMMVDETMSGLMFFTCGKINWKPCFNEKLK